MNGKKIVQFPCTHCGLCCKHLELNPVYAELNRGDGVCKHFDAEKRACSIYETRPALCRVDESYPLFAQQMSLEEYHLANWQACQALMVRFGTDFNHQQKGN